MVNWQMREEITFRCPDCGHIQHEMTPECQACRKTRTAPMQPEQSEYHKIDKGKPWQNGKVERLFKTLFDEWIDFNNYQTPKGLSDSLEEFRNWFNNDREIQKLGYKTPMQIMKEKTSIGSS